jgi:hypothetical protein
VFEEGEGEVSDSIVISASSHFRAELVPPGRPVLTVSLDGKITLGEGLDLEGARRAVDNGDAGAYAGVCRALLRLYEMEHG